MPQEHLLQPERSQLSGRYAENGTIVIVEIIRPNGHNAWQMEVTSLEEQTTEWTDSFASDQEAWDEFVHVVDTEGIAVIL